ncbi:MAG: NAD(+)/NADH kinase [Chthoniobacteraceae bacterium]|jgi:NAD+ kinase
MSAPLIGLVAHTGKAGALDVANRLRDEFEMLGASVRIEARTAEMMSLPDGESVRELAEACEIIVALGGDGTILQVVHDMGENLKPIFGINLGSLGFLTGVSSTAIEQAARCIVSRGYVTTSRILVEVEVRRGDTTIARRIGLNDAVISRGALSRLIRLQTSIDGAALTEYNADGLVISTPTGSTAYSLAAGGPILTPDCGVFAVTPICPHVLTNRSLIFSDRSTIVVSPCEGQGEIYLTVDGQESIAITGGDMVYVRQAKQCMPLAVLPDVSFFEVLRQKLKWSGTAL